MKTLEKKILNKVYGFETKRTFADLFLRIVGIGTFSFLGITFMVSIFNQLRTQQTLDLLELFSEDYEVIKKNIADVAFIFYGELPKHETLMVVVALILLIIFILTLIKNFAKIKNKISSIIIYWRSH